MATPVFVRAVPAAGTNGNINANTFTFAVDGTGLGDGNDMLVVFFAFGATISSDVTSVSAISATFNGAAMTLQDGFFLQAGSNTSGFGCLTLPNPAQSSQNLVITATGGGTGSSRFTAMAAVYENVASIGTAGASSRLNPSGLSTNSPSYTFAVASGNVGIAGLFHGDNITTASDTLRGVVNNWKNDTSGNCGVLDENAGAGASTPFGATSSLSDHWTAMGLELVATGGGPDPLATPPIHQYNVHRM